MLPLPWVRVTLPGAEALISLLWVTSGLLTPPMELPEPECRLSTSPPMDTPTASACW